MAKVTISEVICKGCGLCVSTCPKKIIELDKGRLNPKGYHPARVFDPANCIACAMCAIICPDSAIKVEK
ncbi:4Fe-4S dicluster domain-containing protein [Clostridiaceae bacterium NSJ-31]|uniref:4Fe-4S dicluster domain-containing protein n=1 Tax=Ligaoa zhengdingensis TaxID=2763658 RepID=A0A926DWL8_9FIRM|nr:4Fe-4S dicluster domain-containing protein [Ligaoa zhengdingensis]MBC8545426.1 4Fe-4S dicluster domain-containing protein [Ligaoa zhengdingensis]